MKISQSMVPQMFYNVTNYLLWKVLGELYSMNFCYVLLLKR